MFHTFLPRKRLFALFGVQAFSLSLSVFAAELPLLAVKVHPMQGAVAIDGVIEATRQAAMAAQIPGRVTEVRVEAGQAVKKGDVLMRLDAREAAETAAAAQAQFVNAKANYDRTLRLQQQKFVSQAAVDKARADFDAAAANRGAASAGQSHGVIQAPFNGWVAQRPANLGDMAMPGTPLVTVYDPSSMRVVVNVPQYQMATLRGVKKAQVVVDGQTLESNSVTVVPAADAATHVTQARVSLPAGLREILPGSYARVLFLTGEANKLTVPTKAVVRRGEVAGVYVQNAQGRLSLRQLRLGEPVANDEVEVLAGLSDGEQVVLDPVAAAMRLKSAAGK